MHSIIKLLLSLNDCLCRRNRWLRYICLAKRTETWYHWINIQKYINYVDVDITKLVHTNVVTQASRSDYFPPTTTTTTTAATTAAAATATATTTTTTTTTTTGGMDVCCVLSGRGLCDGLITRPEKSYRLWCVVECDQETSYARTLYFR